MIIGIGNDILEICRIQKALQKEGFLTKYFTENERELFKQRKHNPETISANYSAKEAVSKVFGTGIRDFDLKDIEVLRNDLGQPFIRLTNRAKSIADQCLINKWHITISHTKEYVSVMVIGEQL